MSADTTDISAERTIAPRSRRSLWRTSGIEIAGLLAFTIGMQVLLRIVDIEPSGGVAVAISLVLAGIPAMLWMAFFTAQDRADPEPLHSVVQVGGVSGLLAVAVGQPLITKAFGVGQWIGRSTWTQIAGAVLVIGVIQELCKLIAVRATVYDGNAINQRVDGIVYGAAAGVGYATALNVSMVLSVGGFTDLRAGVIRIVTTALTHGALGALVGYALGRTRLEHQRPWSLPLVLAAAATVNGVSYWLRGRVSERGISFGGVSGSQPARGLIAQAIIAGGLLGAVLWLVRRADTQEIRLGHRALGNLVPLIATLVLGAGGLLGGLVLRNAVLGESERASVGGVSAAFPATWSRSAETTEIRAIDRDGAGEDTTISIRTVAVDPSLTDVEAIGQASNLINVERGSERSGFKVFDIDTGRQQNGNPSARSRYVFTADRSSFMQESLPVVVTGDDTYVRNGGMVAVLTLETPVDNRTNALPRYRRFVSSLRFENG
jgi:protease PrsW